MAQNNKFARQHLAALVLVGMILGSARSGHAQIEPQLNQVYRIANDYERLGYYDKAAEQYAILFHTKPYNTSYYRGLKRNLERLGRFDQLVEVIRQRLLVVDDAMARSDLGSALYKMGDKQAARAEWQQVLQRMPRNTSAYAQVAAAMLSNGLFEEAIEVYKKARRVFHNNYLFAIEIANSLSERRKYAQATQEFLNYLEKNPRQLPYIQRRILSFFDEEKGEKILQVIVKSLQKSPQSILEKQKLYANCLKRLDRFEEALQVYLKIEAQKAGAKSPRGQGSDLYNFANEAVRAGKSAIAIQAYHLLTEKWPKSPYVPSARMGLAEAYLKDHKYQLALQTLDGLLLPRGSRVFALQAMLMKGRILLNYLENPKEAIAVFQSIYEMFPARPAKREAAIAMGDGYLQLGQIAQAEKWYHTAMQYISERQWQLKNKIYFKLAEAAFYHHQFAKSISILEKIKEGDMISPASTEEDLVNDALELTFFIEQALPDSNGALKLYANARKLLAQKNRQEAVQMFEKVARQFPASPVAPRAYLEAANLYRTLQKPEKEIQAYQNILQNYQNSIYTDVAMYQLALAYEKSGRIVEAVDTYEKFLVDFPQSIYLEEARQRLRALREHANQI